MGCSSLRLVSLLRLIIRDRLLPLSMGSMRGDLSVVVTLMTRGSNTVSSRRSILMALINLTRTTFCRGLGLSRPSCLPKDRELGRPQCKSWLDNSGNAGRQRGARQDPTRLSRFFAARKAVHKLSFPRLGPLLTELASHPNQNFVDTLRV